MSLPEPLGLAEAERLIHKIGACADGDDARHPSRQEVRFLVWTLGTMIASFNGSFLKARKLTNRDDFQIDRNLHEILVKLLALAKRKQASSRERTGALYVFIAILILAYAAYGIRSNGFYIPVSRNDAVYLEDGLAAMAGLALVSGAFAALTNAFMYWHQQQRKTSLVYLRGSLIAACIGIHVVAVAIYASNHFYW